MAVQVFDLWQFAFVAIVSLTVGAVVAAVSARTSIISLFEARKSEVQAIHRIATPRLGSIGLLAGYGFAVFYFVPGFQPLLALLPLVIVASAEDLGLGVAPSGRLISVAFAASVQLIGFGFWVDRVDVQIFDQALGHWLIGGTLTVFVMTAVSHSFNLVDGLNGLAASCALAGSAGMALIAHAAGMQAEALFPFLIFLCIVGFLPLNFPKAYLFLGDTGAYLLGFLLSCAGIMIIAGSSDVSPWAVLLCVFWPIIDTTWSIIRRVLKGVPVSSPDREHMHHLAFDFVCSAFAGSWISKFANPLATVCLLPFIVAPSALGVLFWDDSSYAFLGMCALGVSYLLTYIGVQKLVYRADERVGLQRPAE